MNIELIRQDTPGCGDKIFLNSAGASLMPCIVAENMMEYLHQEENLGGYEVARLRENDINEFYSETADLINCGAENIAFTYNATDAYARALSSIPFKKGDFILTTNDDYISNLIAFLSLKKRFEINIIKANNLPDGDLDLEHFENLVNEYKPLLVAVTHIPTNSGLVQPAEAIGKICAKFNTWYLLDACQSVGQLGVDVKKIGCDFLSATGRKFLRGPRGTGFLYVSSKALSEELAPLFIDMRGADFVNFDEYKIQQTAKRFETWECSYASVIGLTEAVRYANQLGLHNISECNSKLLARLRENLSKIAGLHLLDKGLHLSNILTFKIENCELTKIEAALKKAKVFYSISNKYSSPDHHVVEQVVRLSPHYFNTVQEMDKVSEVIGSI